MERIFLQWRWDVAELAGEFGSATGKTAPVDVLPALEGADGDAVEHYTAPALSIDYATSLRRLGLWEGRNARECLEVLDSQTSEAEDSIAAVLDDFRPDLVVVENVFGLPLNPGYARALCRSLDERSLPALLRHHDLIWQRPEFTLDRLEDTVAKTILPYFPPRLRNALHVAINRLSKAQLDARGFESVLVYNGFEFPDPDVALAYQDERKTKARAALGIPSDSLLLVQPTRAIERKGVPDSIDFGLRLATELEQDVCLLVCGPPEDDYDSKLAEMEQRHSADGERQSSSGIFHLILGRGKLPIDLAYEASDFIVFPSRWEGFGNPVVESIIWAKPIVVREYPVLSELLELGLSFISWDPDPLQNILAWMCLDEESKRAVLTENLLVARARLSVESEALCIAEALERLGMAEKQIPHSLEGLER